MKESKNIYELINDMDFNIEDYKKEDLNDLEKKYLKKNFIKSRKSKYNFKKIGIIAAALVLTMGLLSQTNFSKNVYATAQSKILEISYSISKALGIERNIEPYINVVNQVVESKGIEVKLTEVILDEDQLYFATIVDTGKPMDMTNFDYDIYINGGRLLNAGGGAATNSVDDSDTIISTHYNKRIKDVKLTGDIDIKIVFNDLNYYENNIPKKVKGKWEFEFTANCNELTTNSDKIPLSYSFNIGSKKYILEEFSYNPVNQKIYGKVETDSLGRTRYDRSDIKLKGEDNLGNIVVFYLSSSSMEGMEYKYDNYYGDLSSEAEFIILAPYIKEFPEKDGQAYVEEWEKAGEEFTIFLKKR